MFTLKSMARRLGLGFSAIGYFVLSCCVLALPERFIEVDIWDLPKNHNVTPSESKAAKRMMLLSLLFVLSCVFCAIAALSICDFPEDTDADAAIIDNDFFKIITCKTFLVCIMIFQLLAGVQAFIFANAKGLFIIKGRYLASVGLFGAMIALTFIILFVRKYYSHKLYDFLRCVEFAVVIAFFALGSPPGSSFASVLINHFVGFFLLSHLVTTLLVTNRNYSFILYYLISAAVLTLSEILLGSHSISLFASSPTIQHVLSISGIFLLCFYLCIAANLMFSCFLNRTPVSSGYGIIYTFAALCMSATSIYVKDNLAKNPTVRTLFLVIFSLSSTLGLFFAFRLAKNIAGIECDKGDRARPLANAPGVGGAPANALGVGGAPDNALGVGGAPDNALGVGGAPDNALGGGGAPANALDGGAAPVPGV